MIRRYLDRLDDYGTQEPAFNEGHPEDRCPIDGHPVDEHRGCQSERTSTVWRHRWAAIIELIL